MSAEEPSKDPPKRVNKITKKKQSVLAFPITCSKAKVVCDSTSKGQKDIPSEPDWEVAEEDTHQRAEASGEDGEDSEEFEAEWAVVSRQELNIFTDQKYCRMGFKHV